MPATRVTPSPGEYFPDKPLLTSAEVARLMGFRSVEALAKTRSAGRLPVRMFQIPGRRGWYAATSSVRAWVENAIAQGEVEQDPMTTQLP